MPKYIFLDNWVLENYTTQDKVNYLSDFITKNDLTVLITTLLLTEVYHSGWSNHRDPDQERGNRVIKFLTQHPCVIVHPRNVIKREVERFPLTLEEIPIELHLNQIALGLRRSHFEGAL